MAELLICARDATHADPDVDRRACYKRGDPVTVQPDGHPWGRKEGLPRFMVVKVPGVSVEQMRGLIEEQSEDDDGAAAPEVLIPRPWGLEALPSKAFRRRRWRFMVDSVPQKFRRALAESGVATMTPAQIRSYLRRTRDNAQFTGL